MAVFDCLDKAVLCQVCSILILFISIGVHIESRVSGWFYCIDYLSYIYLLQLRPLLIGSLFQLYLPRQISHTSIVTIVFIPLLHLHSNNSLCIGQLRKQSITQTITLCYSSFQLVTKQIRILGMLLLLSIIHCLQLF